MKATYLKIASFFWKDNTLLNFYVDYKCGENPFGTYLPFSYSGSLNHSVFGVYNRPPIDFKPILNAHISEVFKDFGHYDYLSDEMIYAISATMCFYYCEQTNHEFNLEEFKEFYALEKYYFSASMKSLPLPLPTYLDPYYTKSTSAPEKPYLLIRSDIEKELDWSKIHNFYIVSDYANQLVFAENFEKIVCSNLQIKNLFLGFHEILLAELALKNMGRPHFVGIEKYYQKTSYSFLNIEKEEKSILVKQSEVILNNICLMNSFSRSLYENISCKYERFSLSTHIDYIDDEKGNYSIKYNLPVSQNEVLGSNFSINFCDQDVIEVNLKQVMRYTQNYIDFKNSGTKNSYLDFEAIREFFTPILPIDYIVKYNDFTDLYNTDPKRAAYFQGPVVNALKKGISFNEEEDILKKVKYDAGIDYRFSYLYQFLKEKKILSKKFIEYSKNLYNLSFSADNFYEDDQKLFIPFWEIPRMQQIVLEKFLKPFNCGHTDEQIELSEEENEKNLKEYLESKDFENDGIDDYYDADPDWNWNID